MESQAATRRRTINRDMNLTGDQNQRPVWSGSRDVSPIIRHDFATSPWKRFRPSTDDDRRRPLPTSSGNFRRDFPVTDAEKPTVAMQSSESCHPPVMRARFPGFTMTGGMASSTSQHRLNVQSYTSLSTDYRSPQFTASRQPLNVRSRCPGFSVKTDSRFDSVSSTGQQSISLHFHQLFLSKNA